MATSILWVGKGMYYNDTINMFYNTLKHISDSAGKALNGLSAVSSTLKTKFDAIYIEDEIYPGPFTNGIPTDYDKRKAENSYNAIRQIREHTINKGTSIYIIKTQTTDTKKFLDAGATDFIDIENMSIKGLEGLLKGLQQQRLQ